MDQFAKETLPVSLEEEMRRSYLDYAMSVIVGRALPDARDGLKPVHRRVLYAMHETNNVWNRPYVKCARVVGEVMGKYHPHGDMSAPNRPGAVYALLEPFAKHGVSMSRLESRPARTGLWEYLFFVDLEGHETDPPVAAALAELREKAPFLKLLGSYPAAVY